MEKFDLKKFQEVGGLAAVGASYREAFILLTAVHLDLFTTISEQKFTAEDIAEILKFDLRATIVFLDVLSSLNYLKKEKDIYKNSYYTSRYLVKGKTDYAGDILKNSFDQIPLWANIEKVLKTGKQIDFVQTEKTAEEKRHFHLAMAEKGVFAAQTILELIDLGNIKNMLDVGGGAGTFPIVFCQKYDDLKCVIIDLQESTDLAEERIINAGLEERITTKTGNIFDTDYGKGFDLVFISNIIHFHSIEKAKELFKKSFNALTEGGKIIVKDYILDESRLFPKESTLFSLSMLLSTENGNCYTSREIKSSLEEAGFNNFNFVDLSDHSKMIIAQK
ncbi:methyltransferase [candidate division KSB1 bacterium]